MSSGLAALLLVGHEKDETCQYYLEEPLLVYVAGSDLKTYLLMRW